mgnify:CR=1 FL=1
MSKSKSVVVSAAIVFVTLTILEVSADDLSRSIVAITSNQRPIDSVDWNSTSPSESNPGITILILDAVQSIQEQLSEGLPNDETLARALVQQKIAELGRSKLEDELRAAYLPLGTMMAYGLDRYPVIIFDKQAVIYGMTDLSLAINRYRQWLKDKNGGGN